MALELQIAAATALVTTEPKEKLIYEGQGENKRPVGRVTDVEGRPLSAVRAVVIADHIGVVDAEVRLPDVQMTGMVKGAVIRIEGTIDVRLAGQEYGVIKTTVTGERQTPIGNFVEWTTSLTNGKPKPGTEGRP